MSPYPLRFDPIYKPKVWGGRRMEMLGRTLPGDEPIGESWELADLESAAGAGGGGAERSIVANGPLRGRSIRQLLAEHGPHIMGDVPLNERGEFPLLLKYLDARENLSVQVHPSAAYARRHADAHLKSEAWYVVAADEDAAIYKGVRAGVTDEKFRRAIENGTVESLLIRTPVRPGDCHYLPSGTCHALGAGLLVAEVQTASDTTFRVYDWGRTGRELHIEQALQCIEFGPPDVAIHELHSRFECNGIVVEPKVNCEHFRIEKFTAPAGATLNITLNRQPMLWMVLSGAGRIESRDGEFEDVSIALGQTLLLPASLGPSAVRLEADTQWLEVTFPNALAGLLA